MAPSVISEVIVTREVEVEPRLAQMVFGLADAHLSEMSDHLKADVFGRGNVVQLVGPATEVSRGEKVLKELEAMARRGQVITPEGVRHALRIVSAENTRLRGGEILSVRGKVVRAKTLGQERYVEAIDENTVIFGLGPAGTGKTYLAMAKAVQALQEKRVNRIILTRPAVEAGEKLGFLPGGLSEKIDPYLRPLYDALREMVGSENISKLIDAGIVEVAPLAYMRGRTLSDAFVILDEAQNTTPAQMKMFLTRLGFGTTIVVTGDISQVDLPRGQVSGLRVVRDILADIPGIYFAELGSDDVVRHQLVGRIVDAYDAYEDALPRRSGEGADRAARGGKAGRGGQAGRLEGADTTSDEATTKESEQQ